MSRDAFDLTILYKYFFTIFNNMYKKIPFEESGNYKIADE